MRTSCAMRLKPSQAFRKGQLGVTLTELVITVAVSATILVGAVPWVWSTASAARSLDGKAQAASTATYALRMIRDELEMATVILPLPPGAPAAQGIQVQHDHPGQAPESVIIAYDPARRVLWRKTTSTYLADNVDAFSLTLYSPLGDVLLPSDPDAVARVARIRLAITVRVASEAATAVADVLPGAFSQ